MGLDQCNCPIKKYKVLANTGVKGFKNSKINFHKLDLSSDKKHDELKENLQSEKEEQFPTDDSKLMAESQQIGASPHPPVQQAVDDHPHSKRNYASKECGAKVLYSNEEAENKGAILNDPERDDYMRNPCRVQNKFLIIELCETIQVLIFLFFQLPYTF